MVFDGRFRNSNAIPVHPDVPNREVEMVTYLVNYRYGHLVEDYVRKIENK